ncbi:transferase [Streptomyces sp. NPDC054829]
MTGGPNTQLRAHCTTEADGRITFRLPALDAAEPRLLLRLRPKKGMPEETVHLLPLEADADGGRSAVLEPGLVLPEGRWDAYLVPEPDAARERLRPGMRDQRALVDGHTRNWPSPLAVRVPYTTKDGYLAIRTWLRTAHAEIETITVTDGSMTIRARLHGATLAEGAVVRVRARGADGAVRTSGTENAGERFSFTVNLAELADAGADRVWDVSVRPGTDAPYIRLGRLLDDIADRKEIFVYPAATVGGARVRPYYTVDNDLSVEVKSAVTTGS